MSGATSVTFRNYIEPPFSNPGSAPAGSASPSAQFSFLSFSNPFSTFWSPGSLSCQVGRICSPCVPLLPQLPASLPVHPHCTDLTTLGFCPFAHIPQFSCSCWESHESWCSVAQMDVILYVVLTGTLVTKGHSIQFLIRTYILKKEI